MAHAQKPDFVFRRKGRVHLNRRGRQFSWLLAAAVWASAVVMLGTLSSEVVWSGVKGTGYPLHSPVFPSLPLPCVTVCHHVSTGLYHDLFLPNPCLSAFYCTTLSGIHTNFLWLIERRLHILIILGTTSSEQMTQKWICTVVVGGDRDVIHATLMASTWNPWGKTQELPMGTVYASTDFRTGHLPSTSEEGYRLNQAARSLHIILVTSVVQ